MHCVDLGESFPTRIYLQKSASIQPRTSPSKFGEKFNSLFTSLLTRFCPGDLVLVDLAHVEILGLGVREDEGAYLQWDYQRWRYRYYR